MQYNFNLFYYIDFYKRWRKLVVFMIVVAVFLSASYLSFKPVSYVSTVTLLFSGSGSATSTLGKMLGIPNFSGSESSSSALRFGSINWAVKLCVRVPRPLICIKSVGEKMGRIKQIFKISVQS